jgi:hypothetical protein
MANTILQAYLLGEPHQVEQSISDETFLSRLLFDTSLNIDEERSHANFCEALSNYGPRQVCQYQV